MQIDHQDLKSINYYRLYWLISIISIIGFHRLGMPGVATRLLGGWENDRCPNFTAEDVNWFRQKMANLELSFEFVIWTEPCALEQTNELCTRI